MPGGRPVVANWAYLNWPVVRRRKTLLGYRQDAENALRVLEAYGEDGIHTARSYLYRIIGG